MKFRLGFVSNSSSSSFIIGLENIPKNAEELHKMIWGERPKTLKYYDYTLDSTIAAPIAFGQIVIQSGKITQKTIIWEITSGMFEGYPKDSYGYGKAPSDIFAKEFKEKYGYEIYKRDENNPEQVKEYDKFQKLNAKEWKAHCKAVDDAAKMLWNKNSEKFKGKKLYILKFTDNESSAECVMEHGEVFKNIPHIVINKH
jgi:hypothetical protein